MNLFKKKQVQLNDKIEVALFDIRNPAKFKVGDFVINAKIVDTYCISNERWVPQARLPIERVYILCSNEPTDILKPLMIRFTENQLSMILDKSFGTDIYLYEKSKKIDL